MECDAAVCLNRVCFLWGCKEVTPVSAPVPCLSNNSSSSMSCWDSKSILTCCGSGWHIHFKIFLSVCTKSLWSCHLLLLGRACCCLLSEGFTGKGGWAKDPDCFKSGLPCVSLGTPGLLRSLSFNPVPDTDLNEGITFNFYNSLILQDNTSDISKGPLKSTGLGHCRAVGKLTEEIFVSFDE